MSLATMSVYGLYQYDENLFEELALPEGVERETVINNILLESMELETFIPDPDALKISIGYWSRAQLPIWEHLKETTEYEYNPIWNKDGTIKETETRDLKNTNERTETRNLAGTGHTETETGVNAYNGTGYTDRDQSITDANTTDTGNVKHSGKDSDTGTITRERSEKGNIGVTTTQQMIKEEREIAEFNLIDYIVRSFIERFCLLVY